MADPFTAPVSYESLADFIRENPNRIYRYWIYRHGYTPYEQKQCYSDESLFEETRARLGVLRTLRVELFQKLGLIGVTHGRRFALNGNTGRAQLLDKDLSRDMQFPGEIGHSAICHKLSFSFVGLWLPVCFFGLLAVSPGSTGRHNQGVCTFLRNPRHFDEFVTG